MNRMIFCVLFALVFLGINAQAAPLTFEQAHQKIFLGLKAKGHLDGLSDSQYNEVTSMVADIVAREFGRKDELNLSDQMQQQFFLETIKSVAHKILDSGKKVVGGVVDVSKSIVEKVGPFLAKHKDKFLALASKAIPTAGPVASSAAKQIGVPVDVVKGMIGELSHSQQIALVKAGPRAVTKLVRKKIAGS